MVAKISCKISFIYIENIDRLSRDYDGILEQWHKLTKQKGVILKVLDTPSLDTDQTDNNLLSKFIRNIILHILAFQAENEWQKIKSRQAQGIAVAKASGTQFGRSKTVRTKEEIETAKRYQNQEITLDIALSLLDIKKTAFYNLYREVCDAQSADHEITPPL